MSLKGPLAGALTSRNRHPSQQTGHSQATNKNLPYNLTSKLHISKILVNIYLQIVVIIA